MFGSNDPTIEPFGGGARRDEFTPLALSPLVWLRSDLGITLNGSNVSAWADQSGNGRHVVQGTAANQPAYNATDAGYSGRPSVQFDGGDRLTSGAFVLAQPLMVVIVGNTNGVSGNQYFCDGGATPGNEAVVRQNTGTFRIYSGSDLNSAVADTGAKVIVAGEFNGNNSKIYVSSKTAAATGAGGATAMSGFTLGSYGASAAALLTGKVTEALIFDRVLSATERGQLFDYLGTRYGITVAA
jgi:hypothetical protein